MIFRLLLINLFSFFKRLFYKFPVFYNIIRTLPVVAAINPVISKNALIFVFCFSIIILITGDSEIYRNYILIFILFLIIPMFRRANFVKILKFIFPVFIIMLLYGLYQRIFGLTDFEINWLKSGLSVLGHEGALLANYKRPFSTFAGVPEFTFFISIYIYYFWLRGKKFWIITCFILVFLFASSRGLILSMILAFLSLNCTKPNYRNLFRILILSFVIYLVLIYIFPLFRDFFKSIESRLLNYGTFLGRVTILNEYWEGFTIKSLFLGNIDNNYSRFVWDNLYINLLSNFGIIGGIFFLSFLLPKRLDKKSYYFMIIFLSYAFYADIIYSFYFMFNFMFARYSKTGIIDR